MKITDVGCGVLAFGSFLLMAMAQPLVEITPDRESFGGSKAPSAGSPSYVPGREMDARVAAIAFRLAISGRARCPSPEASMGLVLQHLSEFQKADRPGMITALSLDRGPAVIVVVPKSPAATAGIRPGDVLLALDGTALPKEPSLEDAFDPSIARARADTIEDLLDQSVIQPITLTVLRQGTPMQIQIANVPACPSRVHLARSGQRNGYADGKHVFMTTGLLSALHNDDELAFLIAHEMAHNILGHAAIMHSDAVKGGIGRTFGRSGRIVRGTETAADALAGDLMMDAGFDPLRGVQVLRRLGASDFGLTLFATHAPVGERISAMQRQVQVRQAQ